VTQASCSVGAPAGIEQLDEAGSVWRIGGMVPASDQISWIPPRSNGWVPLNVYVIADGSPGQRTAAVIDTSYPVIESEILAGLDAVAGRDADLTLIHTRPVEFESIGNTAALLQNRTVRAARTPVQLQEYVYFNPRWDPPALLERGPFWPHDQEIECGGLKPGDIVPVGQDRLEVLRAPLRLLATAWLYHPASGTLFTSDSFAAGLVGDPADSPVADEPCWTVDDLRAFLLAKFLWLERADITALAATVDEIVTSHEIRCIAPAHGRIARGQAATQILTDYRAILADYCSRGRS
jgi:flavorubredoxin